MVNSTKAQSVLTVLSCAAYVLNESLKTGFISSLTGQEKMSASHVLKKNHTMNNHNFIGDYLKFCESNEANPQFHLWSGLVALSSIISRRVWLNFEYFRVYPNLYVVLLSPPGSKKTTAMNIAKGLLRELNKFKKDAIPFSAQCQSKENLVKEWSTYTRKFTVPATGEVLDYTPISIFVTELSQFLGTTTAGHMLDFLTTVWDEPQYERSTNLHGKEIIPGPYVTMCGCTVPDWITTYLKTDVITGGFSRRVIFVYEAVDGEPIPFPHISDEQRAAYSRVVERSQSLLEVGGEMKWDPEARDFYEKWYIHHQKNIPADMNLRFYYKTKFVQMLRVAILLSLSKSDELVLRTDSLQAALAILEKTEVNLPKVFQGMGRNELSSVGNKVMELLWSNQGPMLRKQVEATLWKDANGQETVHIMHHLISSGKLVEVEERKGDTVRRWICLPEHVDKLKEQTRL